MTITVYTLPDCAQCNATKRTLDKYGVPYTAELASEHLDVLAWAKQEGMTSAPVVMVEEGELLVDAWSGFQPHRIKAIAQKREERYGTEAQTG